jgi:hypothetical protein
MDKLYTYIACTKGELTKVILERQESFEQSYIDDGIVVNRLDITYYFSNGVVIKYCNESDVNEIAAQQCAECWISYQVSFKPDGIEISPQKKVFINHCQETFWLKMNKPMFTG